MTALKIFGAALAIIGIYAAVFGGMYLLGGTWMLSSPHATIRIFSMGVAGALMVWIGLRLWHTPPISSSTPPGSTDPASR